MIYHWGGYAFVGWVFFLSYFRSTKIKLVGSKSNDQQNLKVLFLQSVSQSCAILSSEIMYLDIVIRRKDGEKRLTVVSRHERKIRGKRIKSPDKAECCTLYTCSRGWGEVKKRKKERIKECVRVCQCLCAMISWMRWIFTINYLKREREEAQIKMMKICLYK